VMAPVLVMLAQVVERAVMVQVLVGSHSISAILS